MLLLKARLLPFGEKAVNYRRATVRGEMSTSAFTGLDRQQKQCEGFSGRSSVTDYQPIAIRRPGQIGTGQEQGVRIEYLVDLALRAAQGRYQEHRRFFLRKVSKECDEAAVR